MNKFLLILGIATLLVVSPQTNVEASDKDDLVVDLVFTMAMSSDQPLYLRSPGAPYRQTGVRLEVKKNWANRTFLEISPYVWGGYTSTASLGGVVVRYGYFNGNWGINYLHESIHNFDIVSTGGGMSFDAVEFRFRFY